mmetsp:Transcript_20736/g.60308  ORF Transcript_20736/g.60308 Transcript_20736/m.60308 type:complete len:319 (-) Transcript_20736:82-1038(-)
MLFFCVPKNLFGSSECGSDLGVEHEHHRSTNRTEGVGTSTLKKGSGALLLHNLAEAVSGALVHPLGLRLLRLHLKTTTDSVKGVRSITGTDGRGLGTSELGCRTDEAILILLVGVVSGEGVEQAEVHTTVRNDTDNRNTNSVVKSTNTRRRNSLLQTVKKAVELCLTSPDVRGETSTGVVKGVNNTQGARSGHATRCHVDQEKLSEFGLLVSLGEHGLNSVLEGEVERLGGEIPDDVGQVSTPKGIDTLLLCDAGEAVNNSGVTGDLAGDNLRVGILGLDEELHALDGGGAGLGDSTRSAARKEVNHEVTHLRNRLKK